MKKLYIVMAVIEMGAGVALVCCPSATVALLLGSRLGTYVGVILGRVVGVALLALGLACWLAQHDTQSRASRGLASAMVLYNLGVAAILADAGIRLQVVGVALWPAVVIHALMGIWCIEHLLRNRQR